MTLGQLSVLARIEPCINLIIYPLFKVPVTPVNCAVVMLVEGKYIFYSILFYSILFYSILFYSILFYSILFYYILFYSILFYLYSILFYSILFYSILPGGSSLAGRDQAGHSRQAAGNSSKPSLYLFTYRTYITQSRQLKNLS